MAANPLIHVLFLCYTASMISIDDFKKVEIRIGQIISAEKVEGADKLIRCMVDFGEGEPRQILSGIAPHFPDPQALVGRKFPYATNLAPRTIRGFESNGMLMAASDAEGGFSLLEPTSPIAIGGRIS
jgi:methionine--tRNA ligase beta chain